MNETELIEDLRLVPMPAWWQHPAVLAAFALGAVGLTFLAFRAWQRWQSRRPASPPAPPGPPPHAACLARLEALRARRDTLTAYQLAFGVSEILRDFLDARHALRIRYQTTREFLEGAAVHPALTPGLRDTLAGFLRLCYAVKFARLPATDSELDGLLETAGRVIRDDAAAAGGDGGGRP